MYSQYNFSDFNSRSRNNLKIQTEHECCLFFDGILNFIQRNNKPLLYSFGQMMQYLYEEKKEIYIHIFCKNTNKITTCSDRIWISISCTNEYHQENEKNSKQNLFTIYLGYPYSLNFFTIKEKSIDFLRTILESPSYKKIFATQETANDAINIFFNYFKIKIKSATYLVRDNNRWFLSLDSYQNAKFVKEAIKSSMNNFRKNDSELESQIYNYVTKFQSNDPTETDNQSDVINMLSTFHWIMYFIKENQIKLS